MTLLVPSVRSMELRGLIERHRDEVAAILRRYGVSNVRIFGSVARGDADEHSDIDLLFTRPDGMGLFSIVAMGQELSDLLGVTVDAVPDGALHQHLRSDVLADAVAL
ncbi:MAG: nucleotidyltransferase family protein [Aeromicrobium sp.]|uniref:nucleotidyltransferase family protein n=1 Tax=Aeromicrobium sp. TaxID=1871063 RepID=UPI0039E603E4